MLDFAAVCCGMLVPCTSLEQLCCLQLYAVFCWCYPLTVLLLCSSLLCHADVRDIFEQLRRYLQLFAAVPMRFVVDYSCMLCHADARHIIQQLCCCLQELRQAVMNGAEKHPGAVAVEDEFGRVVSLTAFDQQVLVCSSHTQTAVNGSKLQALYAVTKLKPMYGLLPRYCVYLTLGEDTFLMNKHMSE